MSKPYKFKKLITLASVFIVCFLLPLLLAARFFSSPNAADLNSEDSSVENLFPEAVTIGKAGKHLRLPHHSAYVPEAQRDFVLIFWMRLKALPEPGERLVLISKYKGNPPKIQGYAVALRRDGNAIRPVLYWGNGVVTGRWYDFPEVNLLPSEWTMFAVHVYQGRFVGLYSARIPAHQPRSLKFLGGHEIDLVDPLNLGDAELLFGASEGRDFRGKIGPLIIVNPFRQGAKKLAGVLEDYIANPLDISDLGEKSEVALAIMNGRKDNSKNQAAPNVNY